MLDHLEIITHKARHWYHDKYTVKQTKVDYMYVLHVDQYSTHTHVDTQQL